MWELDIILTSILEPCPRHSTLLLAGRATCTCEEVENKTNTQINTAANNDGKSTKVFLNYLHYRNMDGSLYEGKK